MSKKVDFLSIKTNFNSSVSFYNFEGIEFKF